MGNQGVEEAFVHQTANGGHDFTLQIVLHMAGDLPALGGHIRFRVREGETDGFL
jgi:hypothetical protein